MKLSAYDLAITSLFVSLAQGSLCASVARADGADLSDPNPVVSLALRPDQFLSLKQCFQDSNRDYEIRQNFSVNSYLDEMNHVNAIHDLGHSLVSVLRDENVKRYEKNLLQAKSDGDFSQPVLMTGTIAAFSLGAPVSFKLNDDLLGVMKSDLPKRKSKLEIQKSDMKASVELNASPSATELFQFSMSTLLAMNVNSSVSYGGSTNTVNATLSRPIYDRISGSVSATRPAGSSTAGVPSQGAVGVNYGIHF